MADIPDEMVRAGATALIGSHGLSHEETAKRVYAAMKLAADQPKQPAPAPEVPTP